MESIDFGRGLLMPRATGQASSLRKVRKQMKNLLRTLLVTVALIAPVQIEAHDPAKHKGKGTAGEIVSVASDQLELKNQAGVFNITLTGDTRIEHGNAAVDKSHLLKGSKVTVFGTKLPGGELVAREIVITSSPVSRRGGQPKDKKAGASHVH